MRKNFRPSARLIGTIGEDIIKDIHAAVVELVKNSYDADANHIQISFDATSDNKLILEINDDGHGMTQDTVINKWLVPSTSDKLKRRKSPNGRIMQGRKGIGRFASAILGETLSLKTIAEEQLTSLEINWEDFSENKFLDEVFIDINTKETTEASGTYFKIEGSAEKLEQWNDDEIDSLIKELRKLITPIGQFNSTGDNTEFLIFLEFKAFPSSKYSNQIIDIKPLPLLDYYDYRIFGTINASGFYNLIYQNKDAGVEEKVEEFQFFLNEKEKFEGEICIDFRIFDRDPEAIENLLYELSTSGEESLGKNEAKNLLNDISGVSVFRNGFRIRPYGDIGNDWLSLDKKRVQTPALRIGANQISGYIEIQDEELSKLVEKSARDGLKEDAYYDGLISVVSQLLNYVEIIRYSYRQKTGKGRKNHLFSAQIGVLSDFSDVKGKVLNVLQKANVSKEQISELDSLIDKEIHEKIQIAENLEKQIAMYQGQATLGKIMDVVMHEVRKPISWIKNQTTNLNRAYNRYLNDSKEEDLNTIVRLISEAPNQLKIITALFNRLNSLATRNRSAMSSFSLTEAIGVSIDIFSGEIEKKAVNVQFSPLKDVSFCGWREDIISTMANILENAIYWLDFAKHDKKIEINITETEEQIEISIWNNGPKIIPSLIENNSLFIPGISGKITEKGPGTGLGLAIAGEAIARNKGSIKVVNVDVGAKFIIELPVKKEV